MNRLEHSTNFVPSQILLVGGLRRSISTHIRATLGHDTLVVASSIFNGQLTAEQLKKNRFCEKKYKSKCSKQI
jgi:hypothetical protein